MFRNLGKIVYVKKKLVLNGNISNLGYFFKKFWEEWDIIY